MQKELEVWRKDNKKYAMALKAEQRCDKSCPYLNAHDDQ